MLTNEPQGTASTLRSPVLQLPDAEMVLEDNVAVTMDDQGWKTVTKKRKLPKPEQLRLKRDTLYDLGAAEDTEDQKRRN
ncbi:hypothetical protein HPB47_006230 [Ixodes persulcatus]|uniref:Uncharacterized protein n=1 Tax=Ixodes persulcatus TaxID=34615 RepID=A0AC60PAW0_IXOPE|nr:hypothetical protein HPB47_006230 [Ixodes persulcatus]